jgi:hypothetical protein
LVPFIQRKHNANFQQLYVKFSGINYAIIMKLPLAKLKKIKTGNQTPMGQIHSWAYV